MSTQTLQAKKELAKAVENACSLMAKQASDAVKVVADAAALASKASDKKESESKGSSILYKQVSLVTGVLGLAGMLIMGYLFLANPSIGNDKALAIQQERVDSQAETIAALTKTQLNDTQEVKAYIKDLIEQLNENNIEIAKLTTIINERIPAKKQ